MAQAMPEAQESESMEEILKSIKRIIEDDGSAAAKTEPAPAADVLDLTQVVGDDAPTASLKPFANEDVVQSIDAMFSKEKPVETPLEKPAEKPAAVVKKLAAAPLKPVVMEDGLVSDQAAQAAAAALKPIVEGGQKDYSIPRVDSPELRTGNTVEDLLLEALRPMLKAWLDEHLPTIVHKIVEKEVKRIVTFHQD